MDARQLRYFLAIVEAGGVTRAAEQLFIAQPSLSQALNALEAELGVPLFHRVGRRLILSEAGEALVGPARTVLRDLDAAVAAIDEHRGVRSGRLDMVSMPSPGIAPLADLVAAFTERYPAVRLNIAAAFTPEEVVDAVARGTSELGLAGSRERLHGRGLSVFELGAQPLMLVLSPKGSDFEGIDTVTPHLLAGERLIVSQKGSLMRWLVDDLVESGVDVQPVVEVAHRTSILPLVLAGVGHAILPSAWRPLAERMGLRVCRIEPESVLRISLVSRSDRLTPVARAFVEHATGSVRRG